MAGVAISDDVRALSPVPEYDRTPPQDIAAEQSVLGGMLLSKDAIADVIEILRTNDFYKPAHATVFDAILDLYGRGEPADPVTVAAALADDGGLVRVGGASYLHTLISLVPTAANAGYYAKIVAERAMLRRLVEAGTRIVQLGYGAASGQGRDVDDVVDLAQQAVYEVTERRTSEDYTILEELLQPTMDEIEAIGATGGVMSGVPTGFADLDRLTNGLHAGQLIVVAARPGLGKCLKADTLVTDSLSGERMTVAEFVRRGQAGEKLAIHTLGDDWQLGKVRPSDFIHNGVRPVFRMTTRSGRSISATANHPMRTLNGWVPLENLKAGDAIAVPRRLRVSGTDELPDALVAITAYLIGDGCLTSLTPRLSALNPEIRADASRFAGSLGLDVREVAYRLCGDNSCAERGAEGHRHSDALSFSTPSRLPNPLTDHLRAVGLMGLGSADKHVPPSYFRLSTWQLRIFLSRLYATDGWACVSDTKAGKKLVQIGYCSI
ncbi:MAG: replicative helicase, partial [Frankiaceae bacterium]|nr:replicative helicase [Frankiaceae bacterium]